MLASSPGVSVEEIAAQQAVSVRTLQRAFHQYVGVSPKWVLRRIRMWEAVDRIAEGRYESFASLAHELGYFDQSHFAHDFRNQTGFWPRRYERAVGSAAEEYDPSEPQGSRQLRRLLIARSYTVSSRPQRRS
jgi:transcriptional regulator GlxA family with amidase domain